jgi:hypothetical protein
VIVDAGCLGDDTGGDKAGVSSEEKTGQLPARLLEIELAVVRGGSVIVLVGRQSRSLMPGRRFLTACYFNGRYLISVGLKQMVQFPSRINGRRLFILYQEQSQLTVPVIPANSLKSLPWI